MTRNSWFSYICYLWQTLYNTGIRVPKLNESIWHHNKMTAWLKQNKIIHGFECSDTWNDGKDKKFFRWGSEQKVVEMGAATRLTTRPLTKPVQFWTQISCMIDSGDVQTGDGITSRCEKWMRSRFSAVLGLIKTRRNILLSQDNDTQKEHDGLSLQLVAKTTAISNYTDGATLRQ